MELDRRSLLRLAAGGAVGSLLASPARRPPSRPGARGGGGRALVTADLDGFVAVVDLERRRIVRRLATRDGPRSLEARAGAGSGALVGHAALGVVTLLHESSALGGRRVWVTGGRTPRVALYDADAGAARRAPHTIAAGVAPQHVAFGPHAAYVASGEGRSLTVHALGDGRPRGRAATPLGSYNVARGAGRVLTPSLHSGELTVLDAAGRVRWSVKIGAAAHDVCVV